MVGESRGLVLANCVLVYARVCVGVWSAVHVISSRAVLSVKGNPKSGKLSCDPAVSDNMVLRTAGQEGCGWES